MTRLLALTALVLSTACAQVGIAPSTDSLIGSLRKGYGSKTIDAGHNPDLGLTSPWLGSPPANDEFVDTDTERSTFLSLWQSLMSLDVGNSVDTNSNTRFSGGTVQQWYVTTTGNDSTGDGSIGNPWATIGQAWSQVPSTPSQNYQINVAAGVYLGSTISLTGKTIDQPYYVRIVGSDYPILSYDQDFIDAAVAAAEGNGYDFEVDTLKDDTVGHYNPVVNISDENIEMRGFRIIGARNFLPQFHFSECGIWLQNPQMSAGDKIILADMEISQNGHCGIKDGGDAGNIYIDGVFLHDNGHDGTDHHIYPATSGFVIRRNLLVNCDGLGINGNNTHRDDFVITHNIFIGNQDGVAIAGRDWDVQHNVFYQNEYAGLLLYRAGVGGTVKNNIFYENKSAVTGARATIADIYGNDIYHFELDWDYNYVETGSSVNTSIQDYTIAPLWSGGYTFFNLELVRTTAGRVYQARNAGTSHASVEPTGEPTWQNDLTDGTALLMYLGTSLAANTYTNTTTGDNSAGAVFVDVDNYDFTIKTGSSAASAGTDLGYANGALPGVWLSTQ